MNATLFKALLALVPTCLLLSGSTIMFFRGRTLLLFVQFVGAFCILLVVLTHACEGLRLLDEPYPDDELRETDYC